MARLDYWAKKVFNDPCVFADLFNSFLFNGKPVVLPETLTPQDPSEVFHPADNRRHFIRKERDILKKAMCKRAENCSFILFGFEAQSYFDPTMPARGLLYEALDYNFQLEEIKNQFKQQNSLTNKEFVAGFPSDLKLIPVITLVLFLSNEEWPKKRLHDILDIPNEEIGKYVHDYPLNLIIPQEMSDEQIMQFGSEIRSILFSIKYANNKDALLKIVKNNDAFQSIHYDTARLILEITNLDINLKKTKEGINMAEQMEKWSDHFLMKGIQQGRIQGEIRGIVETMLEIGKSYNEIRLKIMDKFSLSSQEAQNELDNLKLFLTK